MGLDLRIFLLWLALSVSVSAASAQTVVSLNIATAIDEELSFPKPVLNGVEVVALAESIHTIHQFPLERLQVGRWLHRNDGDQVLAFEESPEDVWISQDRLLKAPQDLRDSTSGFSHFGIRRRCALSSP